VNRAWGFGDFAPYVPVAERRANGQREAAKRCKKAGRTPAPVVIEGKKIASTFWGVAWCDNLERYSDFANRLPRGRTYARNGSVVDLLVTPGQVSAFVAGSDLYSVKIAITRLASPRWKQLVGECAGKIGSLVGLLRGELSADVLAVLTRPGTGLFPEPREIDMDCSCPDGAYLCKHLAAVLYGVGARLDAQPELFFTLRQVDQAELLAGAGVGAVLARANGAGKKRLAADKLGGIFGIEMEADAPAAAPARKPAAAGKKPAAKAAAKPKKKR
jgi:uncharacterized Zn finger protein